MKWNYDKCIFHFIHFQKISQNVRKKYIYNYENSHSLCSLLLRFLSTSALNNSWTMVGIDKAIIL